MPCQGKAYNKYHQDFGLCQAGTSCHLSKDFNVQSIGVPGAKTWRGAVYAFQSRYTNGFHREWVATHTDADNPVENYAYLGMSVTTGHFFDKRQHAWASGAPRANDTGAVLLFEKNRAPNTNELELNRTLVGKPAPPRSKPYRYCKEFRIVVFTLIRAAYTYYICSCFSYLIRVKRVIFSGIDAAIGSRRKLECVFATCSLPTSASFLLPRRTSGFVLWIRYRGSRYQW